MFGYSINFDSFHSLAHQNLEIIKINPILKYPTALPETTQSKKKIKTIHPTTIMKREIQKPRLKALIR